MATRCSLLWTLSSARCTWLTGARVRATRRCICFSANLDRARVAADTAAACPQGENNDPHDDPSHTPAGLAVRLRGHTGSSHGAGAKQRAGLVVPARRVPAVDR